MVQRMYMDYAMSNKHTNVWFSTWKDEDKVSEMAQIGDALKRGTQFFRIVPVTKTPGQSTSDSLEYENSWKKSSLKVQKHKVL